MNPYVALAVIILWGTSVGGSFWYGTDVGKDSEKAKAAEVKQAIEDTREIARQGAASEIAKIKVRNTTIQGKLETITRDNIVYRDCQHTDDAFRLLNESITGKASPAGRDGSDGVPGAVAPGR